MGRVWAIAKREFNSYFKGPMGWVLCAIYCALSGMVFSSLLLNSNVELSVVLSFMKGLFFLFIPIITMRSISEDKKNGTEVLLMTSPSKTWQIVLGKYCGTVLVFGAMSLVNLLYVVITLAYDGRVDIKFVGTLIAYLLTALSYIAIGVFASSLTENQIIAAVISFVVFVAFEIVSQLSSMFSGLVSSLFNSLDILNQIPATFDQAAGNAVKAAMDWINPANRLAGFSEGTFDLMAVIYFIGLIVVFLYITMQILEKRRWSK